MEINEFKTFVNDSIKIIIADLDQLQTIAEKEELETTTTQTTIRPDDDSYLESNSQQISRCTIPIVMVCFSVIDMIGQWLKNKKDDDFGSSAYVFFKELSNIDDLKTKTSQEKFKENFRHSIMHSFFAKKGFRVSYLPYQSPSLFVDNFGNGSTLNVRFLLKVVREGLDFFKNEIRFENSDIAKNAFVGYQEWLKKEV